MARTLKASEKRIMRTSAPFVSLRQPVKRRYGSKKPGSKAELEFSSWLDSMIERNKIQDVRRKRAEYVKVYSRVHQLMPQMLNFVETIFSKVKSGELNGQLVFLGRGSHSFYRIAFMLAESYGIQRSAIKSLEAGRRLSIKVYEGKESRKQLMDYLKHHGIDSRKPATFIDTGVIGTVPADFITLFEHEAPNTKVNGYMFYGRDVEKKGVGHYSPSNERPWFLNDFTEREVRSLIEELPKPILTVKEIVEQGSKVKPKRVRASPEEVIGSLVVKRAIKDFMRYRRRSRLN